MGAVYPESFNCVFGFVDGHAKLENPHACTQANVAWYDGGLVSWTDDRYKDPKWNGSSPLVNDLSGRPAACGNQ
jgi:hypothetical protein